MIVELVPGVKETHYLLNKIFPGNDFGSMPAYKIPPLLEKVTGVGFRDDEIANFNKWIPKLREIASSK